MFRHSVTAALVLAAMALAEWRTGNPFLGVFCFTALYAIVVAFSDSNDADGGFLEVNSYQMFAKMRLLATVAMELSALMMFCHVVLTFADVTIVWRYAIMTGWIMLLYGAGIVYARFFAHRWKGQELFEFVTGAAIWVTGDVMMLRASGLWGNLIWSVVWTGGVALIYFALTGFSADFEAVGQLADDKLDAGALRRSNRKLDYHATMVSLAVAMLVMLLWTFGGQKLFDRPELPRALHVAMMQLPVFFMLAALVYALRQPLDARNREKLMLYIDSKTTNERIRASLYHQLVRGHRVSFWTRLLCWILMPFARHKVIGKEHIRKEDFPSHDTMSTFNQSITALEEGDNLLLFAEKAPDKENGETHSNLRKFYTGFAHLGKLYHAATGKAILFYPVFADRHRREIRIGDPVAYNPALPSREAKQALAEELYLRTDSLSQQNSVNKKNKKEKKCRKTSQK